MFSLPFLGARRELLDTNDRLSMSTSSKLASSARLSVAVAGVVGVVGEPMRHPLPLVLALIARGARSTNQQVSRTLSHFMSTLPSEDPFSASPGSQTRSCARKTSPPAAR